MLPSQRVFWFEPSLELLWMFVGAYNIQITVHSIKIINNNKIIINIIFTIIIAMMMMMKRYPFSGSKIV